MTDAAEVPKRRVGICGIGQMGSACAVAFSRAGHDAVLWARDPDKLAAVESEIDRSTTWCDEHVGPPIAAGGSVSYQPDLDALDAECDVILDCIIEVLDQKVALLRRFPKAKSRGALFLSATSALPITEMSQRADLESLLVGAHFWNPPHLIPVVEVIQGDQTPRERVDETCALLAQIGKRPIVCKDVPGFVGNRLLHALWREAIALVDQGVCSAADVDEIVKLTFALRLPLLGPIENMDYVGLDATARLQRFLGPHLANNIAPRAALTDKLAAGDLGVKTGRGFYDWSERDAADLLAKRDAQVLRQLRFLQEIGEL